MNSEAENSHRLSASESLARLAVEALLSELELFPKPGLVSSVDSGSHSDMDHALLKASALGLCGCFEELAQLGATGASFVSGLVPLGIRAERCMMKVTGGVNTHRGAIFSMGLLVAATASLRKIPCPAQEIRQAILVQWGSSLQAHAEAGVHAGTHGSAVRRASGAGGARAEAAAGFPSIFEVALPCFTQLLKTGVPPREAGIETLFLLMSSVPDTNILHRGGEKASAFVMERARDFLHAGGIKNPAWWQLAHQIHKEFVARNLSPGGSADLLAGTFFLHTVLPPDFQRVAD
jgi:triphosphoribosyl-dephospho-CoA synthase